MAELTMKATSVTCCLLVLLIGVKAKDSCPTASSPCHCMPGLPGKNGRDGQPGRDGAPGPPGELSFAEFQQLRREVVDELLEFGAITPSECITILPSSIQPEATSSSIESYKPFTSIAQTNLGSSSQSEQSTIFLQPTPNVDPSVDPEITCFEGYAYGMSASTPATSCKQIYQCNPNATSGSYWLNTTSPIQVFCNMNATHCGSITGGWMRAVYLYDGRECSFGVTAGGNNVRGCIGYVTTPGCKSSLYPTHAVPYSKVCGRAHAYQYGIPDGFRSYHLKNQTLDGYYVDGLSITHGIPRSHIWTFAAGQGKYSTVTDSTCPCAIHAGPAAPPFVGENYFCESGFTFGGSYDSLGTNDPLFDSQGCPTGSTCCTRGGPWFSTTLGYQTDDDIELRWCFDEPFSSAREEVVVQLLEIYIQ